MDWESEVNRPKQLHLKWVSNEILLYSMRTVSRYLQQSMKMGEKITYACICNWVPMLYSKKNNNKKRRDKHELLVVYFMSFLKKEFLLFYKL